MPPSIDPAAAGALRRALLSSSAGRAAHRQHAVLLVARGLSCRQAAALLGASPRAVSYWVRRYNEKELEGLRDPLRPGRRPRLPVPVRVGLPALAASPPPLQDAPAGVWTGAALRAHLWRVHQAALGLRQCQRLLRWAKIEQYNKTPLP